MESSHLPWDRTAASQIVHIPWQFKRFVPLQPTSELRKNKSKIPSGSWFMLFLHWFHDLLRSGQTLQHTIQRAPVISTPESSKRQPLERPARGSQHVMISCLPFDRRQNTYRNRISIEKPCPSTHSPALLVALSCIIPKPDTEHGN